MIFSKLFLICMFKDKKNGGKSEEKNLNSAEFVEFTFYNSECCLHYVGCFNNNRLNQATAAHSKLPCILLVHDTDGHESCRIVGTPHWIDSQGSKSANSLKKILLYIKRGFFMV